MTAYRVGIHQREGSVDGWAFDLPGCRAIGGSVDEVLALMPIVIGEHIAWLQSHGESVAATDRVDIEVVERAGHAFEFCFEADKRPLSDADVETAVRRVTWAHGDLVALTRSLPDSVLDWKPPASAVKIDAIFPDVRTIRDMTGHVVSAMGFHIRGVGDVTARVPDPASLDLDSALATMVARLRGLNAEERSGASYKRSGPRGAAEWSARKSVRRIINHIRFHTREVEQRLCWLTLGVPEVLPVSRE